jgi:hypothetical protein
MSEPKYDVGDMVELDSSSFEDDMYEGTGLIVKIENSVYNILVFSLKKISRKNLSTVVLGQRTIKLPVEIADEKGYLRPI